MIKTIEELKVAMEHLNKNAQKIMNTFTLNLTSKNSAAYTLSWSDNAFGAAAELELSTIILNAIAKNEKISLEDVVKTLTEDILRYGRFPSHSTSVVSNLMEEKRIIAKAELLDKINHF